MNNKLGRRIANAFIIGLAIIWLIPLIFSILMSFRPQAEPVTQGSIFVGSSITLANYASALSLAPWGWHYFTSVAFVVGVLVVQVITVTMAGYAFARMKFRGRDVLLFLILLQLMIPTGVLLVQNVDGKLTAFRLAN